VAGLSGDVETRAFAELARSDVAESDRLWSVVTERVVPALRRADFAAFGEAVYEYGCGVGATFAAVQGGVFTTPATERVVAALRRRGVRGVGQTSWGPTVFAFTPDAATAGQVAADLQTSAEPLHVLVTAVRAGGARLLHGAG
jgi:predicted sugar kinase